MADRFWRGGAGTWDTTSTTNWSATSGGVGGASVPTAADNVFFDQAGAYTVTMTGALNCLDITVSAGTVTFATGTSPTLNIRGSMSLLTGTVWGSTGNITFSSTSTGRTVTTNGVTISGSVTFNGAGGGWTLGSALTLAPSRGFSVVAGTFDTSSVGNYSISCGTFTSVGSSTRVLNLNNSTITFGVSVSGTIVNFTNTGITLNAGTSTFSTSQISNSSLDLAGLTYYDLTFNNGNRTNSTFTINGSNTFNNFSISGQSNTGSFRFLFSGNQTINTLILNAGINSISRTSLFSSVLGTQRTLNVTTTSGSLSDYDFRDIAITGAAAPLTGSRLGDCGRNSGITFPAPKTVYYRNVNISNWGNTISWSETLGGTADSSMFPLAQDTAVFPATTYPSTSSTVTINAPYNIGTIDMSLRTVSMTLAFSPSITPFVYGDFITGTGIAFSGTSATLSFSGDTNQNITSAGKSFTNNIAVEKVNGSFILQDNFTTTGSVFTLSSGTIDLQSYTLSVPVFSSSNSATRSINFGTGQINCTSNSSTNPWNTGVATGLTTTGSKTVNITSTLATGSLSLFSGNNSESNALDFNFTAGSYTLNLFANSNYTVRNINLTGFSGAITTNQSGTIFGDLTLSSTMTGSVSSTFSLTFASTSATPRIITSYGKTLDFPILFNGVGGTWKLADALTLGSTRALTLTSGNLDLDSNTLTAGLFASNNSNARSIRFALGNIVLLSTGTIWNTSTSTNLTCDGNLSVVNYNSSLTNSVTFLCGSLSPSNSINFNFGGSGAYPLTISGVVGGLDMSSYRGILANSTRTICRDFFLTSSFSSTPASGTNVTTFEVESGNSILFESNKTLDFPITINSPNAVIASSNGLVLGLTRTLTLTAGTLALFSSSSIGSFSSSNSNTRTLALGSNTLTVNGTLFDITNSFGMTIEFGDGTPGNPYGLIDMASASTKTFNGGGLQSYPTLNQGGSGTLTITGNNKFYDLTATVKPSTISFTGGSTNIFTSFSLSGISGSLVTLTSTNTTQATLQKSSIWYMGNNSTNAGNNTGLTFTSGGGIDYLSVSYINGTVLSSVYLGNFFAFF
jgi:hypothetical protein